MASMRDYKPQYSERIICESKYWGMWHKAGPPTTSAIVFTFAIFCLVALIEVIVHTSIDDNLPRDGDSQSAFSASTETLVAPSSPVASQPQPSPTPLMAQTDIEKQSPHTLRTGRRTYTWCSPTPSRNTRGLRLFLAGFFLYPAFAAMFIRIDLAKEKPYIDPVCAHHVHWSGPNWAPIIAFNIIPFALGCCAFLRALVDFVLGFFGMGLSYTRLWRAFPWMPCMPVFMVGVVLWGLFRGVRWPVVWVLEKVRRRRGEVEHGEEERKGLVDRIDGEGDESEGSSGYDASPKTSSEGGKKGEKLV